MGLGVVLCFSILIYIFFCISVVVLRLICHSYWLVLCLLVRVCLYCSWCPLYFGCSAYVVLLIGWFVFEAVIFVVEKGVFCWFLS